MQKLSRCKEWHTILLLGWVCICAICAFADDPFANIKLRSDQLPAGWKIDGEYPTTDPDGLRGIAQIKFGGISGAIPPQAYLVQHLTTAEGKFYEIGYARFANAQEARQAALKMAEMHGHGYFIGTRDEFVVHLYGLEPNILHQKRRAVALDLLNRMKMEPFKQTGTYLLTEREEQHLLWPSDVPEWNFIAYPNPVGGPQLKPFQQGIWGDRMWLLARYSVEWESQRVMLSYAFYHTSAEAQAQKRQIEQMDPTMRGSLLAWKHLIVLASLDSGEPTGVQKVLERVRKKLQGTPSQPPQPPTEPSPPQPPKEEPIIGGEERTEFEPGDKILYQNDFSRVPVGETVREFRIGRGTYECVRFHDRIWVRPNQNRTMLYMPLKLPSEFSVEFTAFVPKEGARRVNLQLHTQSGIQFFQKTEAREYHEVLAAARISSREMECGASDEVKEIGRLYSDTGIQTAIGEEGLHRVAIQVRRGQIRFFLDGKRIGMRPFQPKQPIGGFSLYFDEEYTGNMPFPKAPPLLTALRIATYTQKELPPLPEADLLRELGAERVAEGIRIRLQEKVLFDFGKWQLKPEARATLQKVAQLLQMPKYSESRVRVEGHTDNVGSTAYNLLLSEARAYAVAFELTRLGVNANRLEVKGFGESRPVATNDTEEGRSRNRRVEITILAPGGTLSRAGVRRPTPLDRRVRTPALQGSGGGRVPEPFLGRLNSNFVPLSGRGDGINAERKSKNST